MDLPVRTLIGDSRMNSSLTPTHLFLQPNPVLLAINVVTADTLADVLRLGDLGTKFGVEIFGQWTRQRDFTTVGD